ncbi:MAG: hypothetical protein CVV11_10125 [Gammaproteobacteria bacterium HGW-Gammaproteobacteria-15]|nr:MAG: hypothetical protein CVV11_10125 [Gammaproteobacteria bacterium HGW-Gammaproteobacteria-15]
MSDDKLNIIDNLLQPVIEELKSIDAVSCADIPNSWLDLGWDISSGDGEIVEIAARVLESYFSTLPSILKIWLWFKTPGGRVEVSYINNAINDSYINNAINDSPLDFSSLVDDFEEVYDEVLAELKERLYELAEQAYEDFSG